MYKYLKKVPNIEDYYPIYLETGWNEALKLSKDEVEKAINNSFICISVYDDDKLIGFGRVNSDGVLYACIYDVIVRPSYHKKGIGSEIVKMLVSHCKSINMRRIHLFTAKGIKEFYIKLGFEQRPDDSPGMRYIGK